MSIRAISNVLDYAPESMKPTELLVMLILANYADENGLCWPSLKTISRQAHLSKRQVIRVLSKLEDAGEFKAIRRKQETHKNTSNLYCLRSEYWKNSGSDNLTPPIKGSDNLTPKVVTPRHYGSDNLTPKVVTPMSPDPLYDPSIEPSIEYIYADHPENQALNDVISAICSVVKNGDPLAPSPELERCAHFIIELEAVEKIPGFADWWQVNSYYDDNGRPALKSFRDEFQNYLDGVSRKVSGERTPQSETEHFAGRM